MERKEISVRCDCITGCTNLVVEKYDFNDYSFRFESSYLKNSSAGIFRRIWSAVTQKPIVYAEVYLGKDKFYNFIDKLEELKNEAD